MREWQAGDVAMSDGSYSHLLLRTEKGWASASGYTCHEWSATNLRRLVVIDPEDREQIVAVTRAGWPLAAFKDALADSLQAALRSLIAPAKPEEPLGLGAVVEDADGLRWVRTHIDLDAHWRRGNFGGEYRTWDQITAVKVLSEGVQ